VYRWAWGIGQAMFTRGAMGLEIASAEPQPCQLNIGFELILKDLAVG